MSALRNHRRTTRSKIPQLPAPQHRLAGFAPRVGQSAEASLGLLARGRPRRAARTRRPRAVRGHRIGRRRLRRSRHVLIAAQISARRGSTGRPPGRLRCLGRFPRPLSRPLVLHTLDDPDPRVQAAAVRQLRHRGIHDAMERLVMLLDHSAVEVRDAARSSLAEFNFSRFRGAFDTMDDTTRRKIGRLVAKVDPTSISRAGRSSNVARALHQVALAGNGAGDGRRRRGVSTAGVN